MGAPTLSPRVRLALRSSRPRGLGPSHVPPYHSSPKLFWVAVRSGGHRSRPRSTLPATEKQRFFREVHLGILHRQYNHTTNATNSECPEHSSPVDVHTNIHAAALSERAHGPLSLRENCQTPSVSLRRRASTRACAGPSVLRHIHT